MDIRDPKVIVFTLIVRPSTLTKVYSRAIYNGLDLLGDVGGLFDGLKILAAPLISLLTQGGLYKRLISLLFFLPSPLRAPGFKIDTFSIHSS